MYIMYNYINKPYNNMIMLLHQVVSNHMVRFSKRKYVAAFESEKGFMSLSGDVGQMAHDMLQLNEDSLFIQF